MVAQIDNNQNARVLKKPAAGEMREVVVGSELDVSFSFDLDSVLAVKDGDNLILTFEDQSVLKLLGFVNGLEPVDVILQDGTVLSAEAIMEAIGDDGFIDTAASAASSSPQGSGSSTLSGFGETLDGFDNYESRASTEDSGQAGRYSLSNDTADVTPPEISLVDLTLASDSGVSNSDNLTNTTDPIFTGTAEAYASITLYDGATVLGTAKADGAGGWSITVPDLSEGIHNIQATATDAYGNTSPRTAVLPVEIDRTTPDSPEITFEDNAVTDVATPSADLTDAGNHDGNPSDNLGDGYLNNHEVGDDGKTSVHVEIPEGARVGDHLEIVATNSVTNAEQKFTYTLREDEVQDGVTVNVNASGEFNLSVAAHAYDDAGNTSLTTTQTIHVDTTIPSTPRITFEDNAVADVATSSADHTDAGNHDGNPTDNLGDGYLNNYEVGDDGKTSVHVEIPEGARAGDHLEIVATNSVTNAEQKFTYTLTEDEVQDGVTVNVNASGEFNLSVAAHAYDDAGNTSLTTTQTIDVDTVAPTPPSLDLVTDSGSSSSDNITNVASPFFSNIEGMTANVGDTIRLYDGDPDHGGTQIGTAEVQEGGIWSAAINSTLTDGPHTIFTTATDPAGNTSTASSLEITIDTGSPVITTEAGFEINEVGANTPVQPIIVGQVEASDSIDQHLTYSIDDSTGNASFFTIDDSGTISVDLSQWENFKAWADYESSTGDAVNTDANISTTVNVIVTDDAGYSSSQSYTVDVKGMNDNAPELDYIKYRPEVTEHTDAGMPLASVRGMDADVGEGSTAEGDLVYSFVNGTNDAGYFHLAENGDISLTKTGSDFYDSLEAGHQAVDLQVVIADGVGENAKTSDVIDVHFTIQDVNEAPTAVDFSYDRSTLGLSGKFFAYDNEKDGDSAGNKWSYGTALDNALKHIDTHPPDATFIANNINFAKDSGTLNSFEELQDFIGSQGYSVVQVEQDGFVGADRGIMQMEGAVRLEAGTHQFRIYSDDGFQIKIDGVVVKSGTFYNGENVTDPNAVGGKDITIGDSGVMDHETDRRPGTSIFEFDVAEDGYHNIEIVYWDQGSQYVLQVEELVYDNTTETWVGIPLGGNDLVQDASNVDPLITDEDIPLTIDASVFTAQATDLDCNDLIKLETVTLRDPSQGQLDLIKDSDGNIESVTFIPNNDTNGDVELSYTVKDKAGALSESATATIHVHAVNDRPEGHDATLTSLNNGSKEDGLDFCFTKAELITLMDIKDSEDGTDLDINVEMVNYSQCSITQDGDTFTIDPVDDFNGKITLKVTVTDSDGSSSFHKAYVHVSPMNDAPELVITDLNDTESTSISVSESTAVGTVIAHAVGTDIDVDDVVKYSFKDGTQTQDGFAIDKDTGDIFVVDPVLLDVDAEGAAQSVTLTVVAKDVAGEPSEQDLTIKLTDENDNRVAFSVPKDADGVEHSDGQLGITEVDVFVGSVAATDADVNSGAIKYSIVEGGETFRIDDHGNISVRNAENIDRDSNGANEYHTIKVSAVSGDEGESVQTIQVKVDPANEFKLTFDADTPAVIHLSENPHDVTTVHAVDADFGENVTYELLSHTDKFDINSTTGEITVKEGVTLDHEADTTLTTYTQSGSSFVEGSLEEGSSVVLTQDIQSQKGAMWSDHALDLTQDFSVTSSLNFGSKNGGGADGMTFMLHPDGVHPNKVGHANNLGANTEGIVVEFDTWANDNRNDIAGDHMAIHTDGDLIHGRDDHSVAQAVGQNLDDGQWYKVNFTWDASAETFTATLYNHQTNEVLQTITLDGEHCQNLGDSAYFGFTAATGWASNLQQVRVDSVEGHLVYDLQVQATSSDGNASTVDESVTTIVQVVVDNANDVATGEVDILGTETIGHSLYADASLYDPDGIASTQYQWFRGVGDDKVAIEGATGDQYTLSNEDRGQIVTVETTVVDIHDNPTTFTAQTDSTITNPEFERTLSGSWRPDEIIGNDAAEKISGQGRSDILKGQGGDDTINGDDGADRLYGGNGNDILNGGSQNDWLYGEDDHDTLNGDSGRDYLYGGDGNDTLNGGSQADWLYGEDDHDTLNGDSGHDYLLGGDGNDTLNGDSGRDDLYGGDGRDTLHGGTDRDTLNGGDGDNDILNGGYANDVFLFTGDDFQTSGETTIIEDYGNGADSLAFSDVLDSASLTEHATVSAVDSGDSGILTITDSTTDFTHTIVFEGYDNELDALALQVQQMITNN